MPPLSIPPQITFVKGRFVTDLTEQIVQLAQYVRLFPQRSIYFQVSMRRNLTQEFAYFKFLNFQVRCWLDVAEEPFLSSIIGFAEWNIQNWDVRRQWDLPVRRGPHWKVHTRAEMARALGDMPSCGKRNEAEIKGAGREKLVGKENDRTKQRDKTQRFSRR